MKKPFLFIPAILCAAGGLAWLGINWYNERQVVLPPITDQDRLRVEALAHPNAAVEPQVALPTAVLPSQKVRLAIGGLGLPDDSMNRQLADLVTAELSGAKGLELVDRQSFDKVLRELELDLSGMVRAKEAVRVGKLLRAEWFLLGSTASSGASNAVIARIVDAQTGVMRDAGVFPCDDASPALAAKLAEFVRACRRAGGDTKPRVFLAVGTFQDLSLNNRLGEFPAQMRAQLIKAYQGSGVTMLEREYVNALLQEVRLDLAGLTDTSASALPRMQSAFWLVDGVYQSYETSGYEVELALNIKRIFGRSTSVLLRGKPGQPLLGKVKAEIDSALSARATSIVPTRLSEARAQMDAGKESFRPKAPGWNQVNIELLLPGPFGVVADEPRRRNLEEAIRAFQTVLLLEPTNREAKVYLAAASLSLGKEDEGRQYCREILDEPSKDKWVLIAQETLTRSLYRASSEERERWLQPAALQAANPSARPVGGESGGEAVGAAAQQNDRRQEVAEELLFATIAKFEAGHFYSGAIGMDDFAAAFGRDQAAAARRLVELYPKMKANAPNSVPYLLASLVSLQVDTNAPVIAEFEQALAGWAEHPETLPKRMGSFWDHVDVVSSWSTEHKLPRLAAKIMEAKARVQETAPGGKSILSNEDRMELAFGYKAAGRWQDALKAFESYTNLPVAMGGSGPWGRAWTVVLTSREAAECRKHLGLPSPIDPREFDIGKSLLCLHAIGYRNEVEFHLHQVGAIAATEDGLWVGFGGKLLRMDAKLGTNLVAALPIDNTTPITCVCLTPTEIWLGTHGEGLIGYDLASHKCVKLTVKDGLLMDFIMSLQLIGDALWIGYGGSYGAPSGGGLGKLDLRTHQSTSFAASLAEGQAAERKPPRVSVTGITAGAGGDVWFIAGNNLRRYRSLADVWEPPALFEHIDALAFQTEDVLVGLGPDIGSSTAFGLRVLAPKDGQWKSFPEVAGLPPGVNALKADGGNVWVGGHSFVALVDPAHNKVLKFAYVPARTVEQIELGCGCLWAQCEKHLYRVPLAATR
jgi:hypothetical protein